MSLQLPLPAGWAPRLSSRREPFEQLTDIARDKLELRAKIRELIESTAERYGISHREITGAITGYADNMIDDLFYETKSRLETEIEDSDPV